MKHFVITISREYGSGGRLIGQALAKRLGIDFYDKEIVNMLMEESGFENADMVFITDGACELPSKFRERLSQEQQSAAFTLLAYCWTRIAARLNSALPLFVTRSSAPVN